MVPGNDAAVVLTGGPVAGGAVVAYGDDGSEVDSTRMQLQARATALWDVPRKADYVVVTPQGAGVFGGLVVDGDDGLAQVPLRPAAGGAGCRWSARFVVRVVPRVDLLGRTAQQLRHLLDQHGQHQRGQVRPGLAAQLDRPPEEHQPGRLLAGARTSEASGTVGASQSSGTIGVSSTANSISPSSSCQRALQVVDHPSTIASKTSGGVRTPGTPPGEGQGTAGRACRARGGRGAGLRRPTGPPVAVTTASLVAGGGRRRYRLPVSSSPVVVRVPPARARPWPR